MLLETVGKYFSGQNQQKLKIVFSQSGFMVISSRYDFGNEVQEAIKTQIQFVAVQDKNKEKDRMRVLHMERSNNPTPLKDKRAPIMTHKSKHKNDGMLHMGWGKKNYDIFPKKSQQRDWQQIKKTFHFIFLHEGSRVIAIISFLFIWTTSSGLNEVSVIVIPICASLIQLKGHVNTRDL